MLYRPTAWAAGIFSVTLFLLVVTPVSYGLAGNGALSSLLFWLGFGGDGNIGAWWSGMLFLLSAIFAFDRSVESPSGAARLGWAALGAALALLSFDEVASLHEFLSRYSLLYLVPLGILGLSLVAYALTNLRRANVPLGRLLLAFALLATVPFQEFVQSTLEWNNPWVYGVRALVEEGTEIAAALTLLAVTSGGLLRLRVRAETFTSLVAPGTPLMWFALGAFALVAAAVYTLNMRGTANWLGASLFFVCALLVTRGAMARREPLLLAGAMLYLLASVGANCINAEWDPAVFGYNVNLRGLFFGSLLLAGPWVLAPGQHWPQRLFWLAPAGCTIAASFVVLQPTVVWSTWPATIGLLCLYIELSAALRLRAAVAPQARAATASAVMTPADASPVVNRL